MTAREIITKMLAYNKDIDEEVRVRVLWRDEHSVGKAERYVPIARFSSFGDGPCFVVEADELDAAKEEKV